MKKAMMCLFIIIFATKYSYGDFGLGLQPSDTIPEKEGYGGMFLQEEFPSYFNWEEYVSSVKDQGECGACVSFAVLGAMESRLRILNNDPEMLIDLAEQDIVSCGPMGSDYGGCKGNKFERVCSYLHQYGVVEDVCFPYTASEIPCDNRCGDSSIAYIDRWRLMDYSYIWYVRYLGWDNNLYYGQFYIPSVEAIKSEVLDGPVPVGMAVFSDFYDYYGGVYDPNDFTYEGLHSVLIIGWDDTLRSWICRNSWGESWGENGSFMIPWTEESFDIRNYDWSYECGYDLCVCNYTLMGFNAVEIDPTFEQPTTTTTSIVVITSTTTIPTTTTTSIVTTTTSIATSTSSSSSTSTSSSTTTTIISDLVIKGRVIESEPGFERSLQGIKVDLISGDKFDWRLTNVYGEFEFGNLLMGQTYVIIVEDDRTRYPENYVLYLTRSEEDLLFVIVEEEKCIVQRTFGDDSKITNSLRWFRDSILMKYEWGRYLVELYYGFSIMKNS